MVGYGGISANLPTAQGMFTGSGSGSVVPVFRKSSLTRRILSNSWGVVNAEMKFHKTIWHVTLALKLDHILE